MMGNRQKNRNILVAAVLLFSIPALVGYQAHACPTAARKKILTLNKRAMEDFDLLEFEAAERKLLRTQLVVLANNCDNHMVAALTCMNLAAVYIMGFGDKVRGKRMFRTALRISKHVRPDGRVVTPRVLQIFDKVRRNVALSVTRRAKPAARGKKRSGPTFRRGGIHRKRPRRWKGWSGKRSPAARLRKRRIARLLNDVTKRVRSGSMNVAYMTCRKAVKLAPGDVKLRVRWALIQARAGDLTGAMRTIKWLEGRISQVRLRAVLLKVVKLADK
jgi:hypothetical protein